VSILSRRAIPATLAALAIAAAILVAALPPEATLGAAIRPVFLHGALVQTGLVVFAAATVAGLVALAARREASYRISTAGQWTAAIVWIAYIISSMIATAIAWGVVIAWYEPRVQASAKVLGASLLCLALTRIVRDPRLSAIANCALGILAWALVKGTGVLQHPLDPIGTSNSLTYKALFGALWLTLLLIAGQIWRALAYASQAR
jgi:hypothetical protein